MIRCRHGRLRVLVLGVVILGLAGSAAAQEDSPNFFGLGANAHFVNADEFVNAGFSTWIHYSNGFWRFSGSGSGCYATVRLPTGALVTGMSVVYHDSSDSLNIDAKFLLNWVTAAGDNGQTQIGPVFESSGTPGDAITWVDIDPDHTIQYIDGPTAQSYNLRVGIPDATGQLRLRGVIIGWNRQISPAPGTATFPDVAPGFWAFQHIEALAASGITTGFPDGTYRPFEPVTRAQMATFLARALGLHWPN